MKISTMRIFLRLATFIGIASTVYGGVSQGEESTYLANFNQIMQASYSQVDDLSAENLQKPPPTLLNDCKSKGYTNPTREVTVVKIVNELDAVSAFAVQSQCGADSICIIPEGIRLVMNGNLNVGALIVRGTLEWTPSTQSSEDQYLCGGYVVVENNGSFQMELNISNRQGWIYIKNNGAVHPKLRSRSFGTYKTRGSNENPTMDIKGRELIRTWSLLSNTLQQGSSTMKLLHNPTIMGWKIGDRLGIAPTESTARGWGQDVRIVDIQTDGTIVLGDTIQNDHRADFRVGNTDSAPALLSAEVVNLSRNIVITGDDFEQVACDPNLPEAVAGEQTSVLGCRCSEFRSKCTVGLHTMQSHGGVSKIENVRVEKCGQRGIEGKYCLHFHKMEECSDCIFRGNAIENSQQRGIIVHGTHKTRVEDNVLYNARGANIYLEDGNEMWNTLAYNVAICPFPFSDNVYHGCTIPGTSNRIADTSDNQSGFFARAGSNSYIGNRAANHFNGMFLKEGSIGRGEAYNKVCESSSRLGRMDGNTWHGNGRFGTYTLGFNYPKLTDQTVASNGYNIDKTLCNAFDANGDTCGLPGSFVNQIDYGNAFVGHYSAGDLQHYGHYSTENNNLMYWKETKNFENGCGAHLVNGFYSNGNVLLPDQATFIIENTIIGDDTKLEANHHCNVGVTGFLCMPTYVLHKVKWKNQNRNRKWIAFQRTSVQEHNNDQNHGGIFTLSPIDAATVLAGGTVEGSLFPQGYVSLVSDKFQYLLGLPNNRCVDSSLQYGDLYDNGILCKTELRALKIYTRGLRAGNAPPQLKVEIWYKDGGLNGQVGSPDSSQLIGFHQIGGDGASAKQGFSVPVIPGRSHSYKISLTTGNLPDDWVIEYSDPVIGNRWKRDELFLSIAGRDCGNGGLIHSQHDRKFIWGGDGYLEDEAWFNHGTCVGSGIPPPDEPTIDCSSNMNHRLVNENTNMDFAGVIEATECPEKCSGGCNENSYCDCGSETCQCKAGFTGANCEFDVCASTDCGEHGSCAARYLGGTMSITEGDKKCICEDTWLGDRCDANPCVQFGIEDCSGNGMCVAVSETEAMCQCQDGFSGPLCAQRSECEGFCEKGSFPYFGCASDISGKVGLGCFRTGGCYYLSEGQDYPYDGFCTYKTYGNVILTAADFPDVTMPVASPVPAPTPAPLAAPVPVPTSSSNRCGCERCTEAVWNTLAGDFTCGARISFLRDSDEATLINVGVTTGPFDESQACQYISDEFPTICTCACGATPTTAPVSMPTPVPTDFPTKNPTVSPTFEPTKSPTFSPTFDPTKTPTFSPTLVPSKKPTPAPVAAPVPVPTYSSYRCGCETCTEAVWSTFAGGFTCGARISFLRDSDEETLINVGVTTGPFDESQACRYVTDEYPDICTCACDSTTPAPTKTPTLRPTRQPTSVPTSPSRFHCGCNECTDEVWDVVADGFTCGSRIQWLQSSESSIFGGPFDEVTSCRKVSEEFPEACGWFCNPGTCSTLIPTRNLAPSPLPLPTSPPISVPAGQCIDSEGYEDTATSVFVTCQQLKNGTKKKRKCKSQKVAQACPSVCNLRCSCKDSNGKVKIKAAGRFKGKRFKCKKLGKRNQPTCDTLVKGDRLAAYFCPKKCKDCFDMSSSLSSSRRQLRGSEWFLS